MLYRPKVFLSYGRKDALEVAHFHGADKPDLIVLSVQLGGYAAEQSNDAQEMQQSGKHDS
jgi:hypothetical protein